jgi:hypothetical protein
MIRLLRAAGVSPTFSTASVMDRRTRREHFPSAALSITDDLLHRSELARSATKAEIRTFGWMLLPNVSKDANDGESHIRLSRYLARSE